MVRLVSRVFLSNMQRNVVKKKSSGKKSKKQLDTERPKTSLSTNISSGIHSSASSSSVNSVDPRRNVRQKPTSKKSGVGLEKSFEKLSLKEKSTSARSVITRSSSSSAKSVCKSLEDVARWILNKRSKNIVVMAGAGISTPSGIPDFRTPGTGLYDNLQQYKIPYPEAVFDIDYFHKDPRPFFTLAKELYPGNFKPNYVHYFVRMLHERGLLLRMYTQNIDGLERLAGIPAVKLVEAHGTFSTASCVRCGMKSNGDDIKATILSGSIPKCSRSSCFGIVKPDIVFFGEDLPKRFFYYLKDFPQCDLLIVMGTSLQVHPFAGIVNSVRTYVPRLLINREVVEPFDSKKRINDVSREGDLVEGVRKFVQVLGWKKAMDDLVLDCEKKLEEQAEKDKAMEKFKKKNENSNNGANPLQGANSDSTRIAAWRPNSSTRSIHTAIKNIMSDSALDVRSKQQQRSASGIRFPQLAGRQSYFSRRKESSSSEESTSSSEDSSSDDR